MVKLSVPISLVFRGPFLLLLLLECFTSCFRSHHAMLPTHQPADATKIGKNTQVLSVEQTATPPTDFLVLVIKYPISGINTACSQVFLLHCEGCVNSTYTVGAQHYQHYIFDEESEDDSAGVPNDSNAWSLELPLLSYYSNAPHVVNVNISLSQAECSSDSASSDSAKHSTSSTDNAVTSTQSYEYSILACRPTNTERLLFSSVHPELCIANGQQWTYASTSTTVDIQMMTIFPYFTAVPDNEDTSTINPAVASQTTLDSFRIVLLPDVYSLELKNTRNITLLIPPSLVGNNVPRTTSTVATKRSNHGHVKNSSNSSQFVDEQKQFINILIILDGTLDEVLNYWYRGGVGMAQVTGMMPDDTVLVGVPPGENATGHS